jgi:hypothetical protein
MNCLTCRELEQAYEAAFSEYAEARASALFRICSNLAARKNVDMERTKSEIEEHSLVCVSANATVTTAARAGHVYELETISDVVSA